MKTKEAGLDQAIHLDLLTVIIKDVGNRRIKTRKGEKLRDIANTVAFLETGSVKKWLWALISYDEQTATLTVEEVKEKKAR